MVALRCESAARFRLGSRERAEVTLDRLLVESFRYERAALRMAFVVCCGSPPGSSARHRSHPVPSTERPERQEAAAGVKRLSKDGSRTYNVGSSSTFEDYPRVCTGCGERVRITKDTIWFGHDENGAKASWHWKCRPLRDAA